MALALHNNNTPLPVMHECIVCLKEAKFKCNRCQSSKYCGQQCQVRDWHMRHSRQCHPTAPPPPAPAVVPVAPVARRGSPAGLQVSILGVKRPAEDTVDPRAAKRPRSEDNQATRKDLAAILAEARAMGDVTWLVSLHRTNVVVDDCIDPLTGEASMMRHKFRPLELFVSQYNPQICDATHATWRQWMENELFIGLDTRSFVVPGYAQDSELVADAITAMIDGVSLNVEQDPFTHSDMTFAASVERPARLVLFLPESRDAQSAASLARAVARTTGAARISFHSARELPAALRAFHSDRDALHRRLYSAPELETIEGQPALPSMRAMPGSSRGLRQQFYRAAADVMRHQPWLHIPEHTVFTVAVPLGSGRATWQRHLVVMGGGDSFLGQRTHSIPGTRDRGLAVFDTRAALESRLSAHSPLALVPTSLDIDALFSQHEQMEHVQGFSTLCYDSLLFVHLQDVLDMQELCPEIFQRGANCDVPNATIELNNGTRSRPSTDEIQWYIGAARALSQYVPAYRDAALAASAQGVSLPPMRKTVPVVLADGSQGLVAIDVVG